MRECVGREEGKKRGRELGVWIRKEGREEKEECKLRKLRCVYQEGSGNFD